MNRNEKQTNIIKVFSISIICPVVLGYLLNIIFVDRYVNVPLHTILEAVGGFIALILAFIIFKLYDNKVLNHLHYTSLALIAMGIIDIFHAGFLPGEIFVWLHSLAVLVGGLLFLTVFLKDREVSNNLYERLPLYIAISAILISIFSILNPQLLPLMLNEDKSFTSFAIAMNIIGGFGFLIAAYFYGKRYLNHGDREDLLFVGHTLLFGIAGILFASSSLWDAQWWLWHILRLCAYLIVLHYMYSIFNYQINQKEKERELSNSILNSQSNFTVITDGEKLTKVNNTVLDFFKYKTLEEFQDEHDCICDFFIKEDGYLYKVVDNKTWLEKVFEDLNYSHKVKIFDSKNNEHIFQINTSGQKVEGNYVVTFTDITITEKLHNDNLVQEKQLLEQSKMASMGNMIGNIAHQWRQPLSLISTLVTGVKLKKEVGTLDDIYLNDAMNNVNKNVQYLSRTIDTFREFIKEKKEYREVILQNKINKTLEIVELSLKNNHIKLINNVNEIDEVKINLIVGELSQVIINILNNSKDAIVEKSVKQAWVKIDLEVHKNDVLITIEDNAGGIPKDIISNIFEPYFTTKADDKGTGLGLYMSYKIVVESLNGDIYVENTEYGAKFYIKLPIV